MNELDPPEVFGGLLTELAEYNATQVAAGYMSRHFAAFTEESAKKVLETALAPYMESKGIHFCLDVPDGQHRLSALEGLINRERR